ncbi:hypothetical protein O9H85_31610 [Paenibacillus filicis]|uniref:Uncharacterized protein n=1 Tax=Paenibacillus gyeongsangnamensis TaxID=3388067 RepID=A0ABT4QIW8_9BACL|nr:hypothetical protein [Paenibacillus filicis]MCZ8516833.1 hypothetical protein [Paenibacillus filicis]
MTKKLLPIDVSNIDRAFGGDVKRLLPPMCEIPEEFQKERTKWNVVE